MRSYKFRVLIDAEVDCFRDIEILGHQTFEDFHEAILKAFDFSGDQMSSFYVSNDAWEKGDEIVLLDMSFGDPSLAPPLMKDTAIGSMITEAEQKFIYVYDFLRMWCFYIELVGETTEDTQSTYPRVTMNFGAAPTEDSKELPDLGGDDALFDLGDEEEAVWKTKSVTCSIA